MKWYPNIGVDSGCQLVPEDAAHRVGSEEAVHRVAALLSRARRGVMARVLSGGRSGHEPGGEQDGELHSVASGPLPHAAIFPPQRPARQSVPVALAAAGAGAASSGRGKEWRPGPTHGASRAPCPERRSLGKARVSVENKGKPKGFAWIWQERVEPRSRACRIPASSPCACATSGEGALLAGDPGRFFTEPHYNGFPAVLVRLKAVSVSQLRQLLVEAWSCQAPYELVKRKRHKR